MFLSLGINIGFGLNTTNIAAYGSGGGGTANNLTDDSFNLVSDDSGNQVTDDS